VHALSELQKMNVISSISKCNLYLGLSDGNGCEANYWDPVIVVIIFGGVSLDTYMSVAASLMTPKLSPQSCVRSTKEYFLSKRLFLSFPCHPHFICCHHQHTNPSSTSTAS